MTNVEKLRDTVKNYQKLADVKFSAYNKCVNEVRNKYKPEAARLEIMQNIWPQASGTLAAERDSAKQKIENIYEDILSDIRKWTLRPVKAETLTLLHSIHDFGIKLTINELKIIETEVSGNLIASKIFAGLASEYGYAVKIPNADTLMQELRELKSFAELAIDGYAGKPDKNGSFPGNDLLEQRKINGIPHGEFTTYQKNIAANFVEKNASLQRTAELMENSNVDLSYSLTERETSRIKGLIDDIEKSSISNREKKRRMSALLQSEPDMSAKINILGGEIKASVDRYLREKSEN